MKFGAVVIGRNEGGRLKQCLAALSTAAAVVYVDSGSTDGSAQWARDQGTDVTDLDMALPFTAARARNAGFRRLREIAPNIPYVHFVDGDSELIKGWPEQAMAFLEAHPTVAAVSGRLRERYPDRSIYNWIYNQEWNATPGEVRYCGGIAMMRTIAVEAVGGYLDDLIAGEEPELCVRLRGFGWHVWLLPNEMALHDVAVTRLAQWWRRSTRTGYAFAQGAHIHGAPPECHWVWESRRAWVWGIWLPLACLAAGLAFGPWGWFAWLVYPFQILRQMVRNRGPLGNRTLMAVFQVLVRFPEAWGQIRFTRDRLLGRRARLIEYK
jgi:GT2 family glycosyltransferase